MAIRDIPQIGDPVLRRPTDDVTDDQFTDPEFQQLVARLAAIPILPV